MTNFFDIHADIAELRAELAECILTRRERAATLQRLETLLAEVARRQKEEGASAPSCLAEGRVIAARFVLSGWR